MGKIFTSEEFNKYFNGINNLKKCISYKKPDGGIYLLPVSALEDSSIKIFTRSHKNYIFGKEVEIPQFIQFGNNTYESIEDTKELKIHIEEKDVSNKNGETVTYTYFMLNTTVLSWGPKERYSRFYNNPYEEIKKIESVYEDLNK